MEKKSKGILQSLALSILLGALILIAAGCGQRTSSSDKFGEGTGGEPIVSGPLNIVFTASASSVGVGNPSGTGVTLDAYVTVGGSPKTNLTTSGEEAQLVFTSSMPEAVIGNIENQLNGHYTAKFTSTVAGQAVAWAEIGNTQSGDQRVTFTPGAVDSVSILASKSTVSPDGADVSRLTITLEDNWGNPTDGTIDLTTDLAGSTITPNTAIETSDGVAEADFVATAAGVAHITATVDGADTVSGTDLASEPVSIAVYTSFLGVPHHIDAEVDPPEIYVKETGGVAVSKVTISIYDYLNNLVDDTGLLNNVRVTIIEGPNGGENIQGNTIGQPMLLTSSGGQAEFSVSAGKYPGVVTIMAEVLLDQDGEELDPPITQTIPKIYIRSGPPFSLVLQRENGIIDNNDGTLTHNYLALVSDKWGNDITDGTSVFFGQIVNILLYKKIGKVSADGTTFTYTGIGNKLKEGDTVVITDMITSLRGGFIIDSIQDADNVVFASPVSTAEVDAGDADAIGLVNGDGSIDVEFYAGNNDRGGVFQGNQSGGVSTTSDGIAFGANTYPGSSDNCAVDENGDPVRSARVNEEVVIWAATEDETIYEEAGDGTLIPKKVRGIGDAELFRFAWVAETQIGFLGPVKGLMPGIAYSYWIQVADNSDPSPYPVPFTPVNISVSGGELYFAGSGIVATTIYTDCEGELNFDYAIAFGKGQLVIGAGGTVLLKDVEQ